LKSCWQVFERGKLKVNEVGDPISVKNVTRLAKSDYERGLEARKPKMAR